MVNGLVFLLLAKQMQRSVLVSHRLEYTSQQVLILQYENVKLTELNVKTMPLQNVSLTNKQMSQSHKWIKTTRLIYSIENRLQKCQDKRAESRLDLILLTDMQWLKG